jgi:hypothetical protein
MAAAGAAVLAILVLLSVAFGGHAAGSQHHITATDSLAIHLVVVSGAAYRGRVYRADRPPCGQIADPILGPSAIGALSRPAIGVLGRSCGCDRPVRDRSVLFRRRNCSFELPLVEPSCRHTSDDWANDVNPPASEIRGDNHRAERTGWVQ